MDRKLLLDVLRFQMGVYSPVVHPTVTRFVTAMETIFLTSPANAAHVMSKWNL
ncbi:hypothetical protein GDO81_019317 [Engystomops pustulosus]|uniref:Uncharacterized protein n=1 Tax=Engystomops pustulosus TaxID=76066 RepID=A0AAV6ZG18_ENGPU|nr:hypothetical protein GDO81_019317 [Engystomops pustulosus]